MQTVERLLDACERKFGELDRTIRANLLDALVLVAMVSFCLGFIGMFMFFPVHDSKGDMVGAMLFRGISYIVRELAYAVFTYVAMLYRSFELMHAFLMYSLGFIDKTILTEALCSHAAAVRAAILLPFTMFS